MNNNIIATLFFASALLCQLPLPAKGGVDSKKKADKKDDKELVLIASPANYEQLTSKGIVFVDYWAAWCGPCRKMNPILKELAQEKAGTLTIAKLNVDDYREFSIKNEVANLPTIIIYKDGKELARVAGLVSKEKLIEVVDFLEPAK